MNILKKDIQKYNKPETLAVISLYPKQGEIYSSATSGVASYTKNVVINMQRPVIVLADYDEKPQRYQEKNALIVRCFRSNSITLWWSLYKQLKKFPQVTNIMIQFDFSIYGNILVSAGIIPFLLFLKSQGYFLSLVNHHVISDIRKLKGHVGIVPGFAGTVKTVLYNSLFHTFYRLLGITADKIILLEESLKSKLSTFVPQEKIVAIPHGVDTDVVLVSKTKARKALKIGNDEEVILFFGYVNWFKGADIFVKNFQHTTHLLGKKAQFIIAGGESPTLKNKTYYQSYFKEVLEGVYRSKKVKITGYIPQEEIYLYFCAADLVIFPYRHFMTASGVLSLVFSYKKPFLVSTELREMFSSADFIAAIEASGLTMHDFLFQLTENDCLKAAENILKNGIKKKMINMTERLREKRAYKNTAILYEQTLFPISALAPRRIVGVSPMIETSL